MPDNACPICGTPFADPDPDHRCDHEAGTYRSLLADDECEIVVTPTAPITKGCIVNLHDELEERSTVAYMMAELRRIAGHDQFVVWMPAKGGTMASVTAPGKTSAEVLANIKEVLRAQTQA